MRDFDAVVIGGGINGLTTAAYLAKAGTLRRGVRGSRPVRRPLRHGGAG